MSMRHTYISYEPTTRTALAATDDFIERMEAWTVAQREAANKLRAACATLAGGTQPTDFISKDALNMSVFGVMFERAPGKGFLPAPSSVAVAAKQAGKNGLAYIPDVKTEEGRSIFKLMTQLSSVCEQRPLLKMKGVKGLSLEGRQLMLTGAAKTKDGVRIFASPRSVTMGADLVVCKQQSNQPGLVAASPSLSETKSVAPRTYQRPSPFNLDD